MVESGTWTELADGDEFAGYRIERRLGRGGMGILYLAIEPGLERRVALKLIAPEAAADEVFTRRFAEESRIAASIEHPNVVPIYAAGEEDGIPYIAMRYVAGSDLGRRIAREGRIPLEQAVALIAQVGNGLDAIHAAGLVHRDVKPANVLLSGEEGAEHAYITDFGVARNVATQSGLTQTGRFVGTLDYVAPEQISGGPLDARVDVYALGCLLYKLLTGQVPFPREGEAARLYAHLNDPPPAPSLYVPEVPMALDDVVVRAMSKQPGDRYPSAGDLGRAAQAALSGTAVALPERTVATGAAATVESATVPPDPPTEPTRSEPTEPTRRDDGDIGGPIDPKKSPTASPQRRLIALAGGAAVLVAVVVLIVVLASGGGGSGDGTAATTQKEETAPVKEEESAAEKEQKKKEAESDRLNTSQLIAGADKSCEEAQTSFKQVKAEFGGSKELEEVPNPEFAEGLVAISSKQVEQLEQLKPPKSKEDEFAEYLEARRRVAGWDRDALKAAREGNEGAYQSAYQLRTETEPERERIASEIGFKVCSQ
ncbi:MAG TPA: serine/threonine-protein kinase [Solirubrobacterales bacterium]|nr:serine/threonine-protein kinase [Solirubrobacterales bacterium]